MLVFDFYGLIPLPYGMNQIFPKIGKGFREGIRLFIQMLSSVLTIIFEKLKALVDFIKPFIKNMVQAANNIQQRINHN
jgi:hypothetical protein